MNTNVTNADVATPKVGETVAVMHASRVNVDGHPSGKLQDAKIHYDTIVQVYLDGDVKVKSGDAVVGTKEATKIN